MTKDITIHYEEGSRCGINRQYTYCGSNCNKTCAKFGERCEDECIVGCLCYENFAFSTFFQICVPSLAPICKFERLHFG